MSSDNLSFVISCVGCDAKLRLNNSARGKTIACPKCGKQMKIKDAAPTTAPVQSVTAPVAAKPVAARPVQARPVAAAPVAQDNWADIQLPPAPATYQPQAGYPAYYAPPKAKSLNPLWIWGGIAAAGAVVMLGFVAAMLFSFYKSSGSTTASSGPGTSVPSPPAGSGARLPTGPGSSFPAATVSSSPLNFPDIGTGIPVGKVAMMHRVEIPRSGRPALSLQIFIPNGEHASQSMPVVFEAPAGTTLLHGARLDPNPFDADIPFTEAGMITVNFSLDGPMPGGITPDSGAPFFSILSGAYKDFVSSDAGVACGSMAIDYVLKKVQAADPKRLYVSGHSSAATLSLLLASKDSRIARCMAFAPATDLNLRLGELLTEPTMQKILPNLSDYLKSGSPITHVRQLKCPVFIAHAQDDDNEPFPNTKNYVSALKQAGGDVTFFERPRGGHYQVMLDAAIPKAIQWLGN